nr:tetratricopeptide repeat protein [uncultured Moraxella sp.]
MFKKLSILTISLLMSFSALAVDVATLTNQAESGDVNAQMQLADYYRNQQNYTNGFYWTQKLANQGDAQAQFNLGYMYNKGKDVRQDYSQALYWYQKSANQGNALAQNNLGGMYVRGVGQDYSQAFNWFQKSANQDYAEAQYNLGLMYENGQGVRQNKVILKELFGKACENGNQLGCDNYRILNQQGY